MHRILPSLVEISSGQHELGSGILFDNAGNVVTNAHVVGPAKTLTVRLSNGGAPWDARLVGVYAPDDLAVIRMNPAPHGRPATFANSAEVQTGDIVLAAGNPMTSLGSTTDGIVGAIGQIVTEARSQAVPATTLPDSIQTSAAVNAGNNGGALVDTNGQVVGLSTMARLENGVAGFAIPSNVVTDIAGQIIHSGHVAHSDRATLGVEVSDAVDAVSGDAIGVNVDRISGDGPAAVAGILPGDLITSINGTGTPNTEALSQALTRLQVGHRAEVHVAHPNGSTSVVPVTLTELRSGG